MYPVMILSYEMFVRCFDHIKQVPFDLVICDEGHRLKNTAIKTTSVSFIKKNVPSSQIQLFSYKFLSILNVLLNFSL